MKKNYKKQLLVAVVAFFALSFTIHKVQDRLGIRGPLEFNKRSFHLVKSNEITDTQLLQEYLPSGQKESDFREKLALTVYTDDQNLRSLFLHNKKELEDACSEDPYYTMFVMEPKNKEERILFYTSSTMEKGKAVYTDFGIWRFVPVVLADNSKAIMKYHYTRRDYAPAEAPDPMMVATEYSGLVSQFSFLQVPALQVKP